MTDLKRNLEITRTELQRSWSRTWKAQIGLNTIPGQNQKQRDEYWLLGELLANIEAAQCATDKAYALVVNSL